MRVDRLGPALRRLRQAKGLSQSETAAMAGKKSQQLSRYEVGATLPDLRTLVDLLNSLDTSLADFAAMTMDLESGEMLAAPRAPADLAPAPAGPVASSGASAVIIQALIEKVERLEARLEELQGAPKPETPAALPATAAPSDLDIDSLVNRVTSRLDSAGTEEPAPATARRRAPDPTAT